MFLRAVVRRKGMSFEMATDESDENEENEENEDK